MYIVVFYLILGIIVGYFELMFKKKKKYSGDVGIGFKCYKCKEKIFKDKQNFYISETQFKPIKCKRCSRIDKINSLDNKYVAFKNKLMEILLCKDLYKYLINFFVGITMISIIIFLFADIYIFIELMLFYNFLVYFFIYYRKYIISEKKTPTN